MYASLDSTVGQGRTWRQTRKQTVVVRHRRGERILMMSGSPGLLRAATAGASGWWLDDSGSDAVMARSLLTGAFGHRL